MMGVQQAIDEAQRLVRLLNEDADAAEAEGNYWMRPLLNRDDVIEFIDAIETIIGEALCLANADA